MASCARAAHMHSVLQLGALGAGGTGTVELMRHRDSGELVAVRFIERGPKVKVPSPVHPACRTHGSPRCLPCTRYSLARPTAPVPAWQHSSLRMHTRNMHCPEACSCGSLTLQPV